MIDLQKDLEHNYLTESLPSIRSLIALYSEGELSEPYNKIFDNYLVPFADYIQFAMDKKFSFSVEKETIGINTPEICKSLGNLDYLELSCVVINSIVGSISKRVDMPLLNLCMGLSRSICNSFQLPNVSDSKHANRGIRLITLFRDKFEGLIEWEMRQESRKRQYFIYVKDDNKFSKIRDKYIECMAILSSPLIPMVVPPREWKSPIEGGYLSSDLSKKNKLIRKSRYPIDGENLSYESMPTVYDAVNAIQSVPWEIDHESYEVLKWAFISDIDIGKLPSSIKEPLLPYPLPNGQKPVTDDQKDVVHKWHIINKEVDSNNKSKESKRLIVNIVFEIINYLNDNGVESVWFPHNLDYRGRVYPITPVFNPQGIDYIKSLLRFKEGKKLGSAEAIKWMAIHGANLYGVDKVSLEDRVRWVKDHEFNIEMAVCTWKDSDWWTKADKPFQFLAWCREWVGVLSEGENWVSKIPVALDGSCSGIQHFSAMLKDPIGAKAVNLVPSGCPNDIYQVVADKAIELLEKDSSSKSKEWLSYGVDRKLTKRSVMTLPYGLTKYSCREYIKTDIAESGKSGFKSTKDAVSYFADVLWEAIDQTLVGAQDAMNFLREIATELSKDDVKIEWITPTGFPVMQCNMKTITYQTQIKLDSEKEGLKTYYFGLNKDSDKLNKKKQVNSICPNFIHSYDASHLILSVYEAINSGITGLSMIHDSFGTYASDIGHFRDIIRDTFSQIYTENNPLHELLITYQQYLPHINGPHMGSLDLSLICESDYAFS